MTRVSSDFLSSKCWSTYVCFAPVTRLMLKHDSVLPTIKERSVEIGAARSLSVTHVDDTTLYSATEEEVNMTIWAAHCYVKSLTKPSPVHSVSFLQVPTSIPSGAATGSRFACRMCDSFGCRFLDVQVPTTPTKNISIETPFSNTMRLSDYNPRNNVCSYNTRVITRECRLLLKISKTFDLEEEPAKRPVDIGKFAPQEAKCSLRKLHRAGKIIIVVSMITKARKCDDTCFRREGSVATPEKGEAVKRRPPRIRTARRMERRSQMVRSIRARNIIRSW